mgnify:FL=1
MERTKNTHIHFVIVTGNNRQKSACKAVLLNVQIYTKAEFRYLMGCHWGQ